LADALADRGVPFFFVTGYGGEHIDARYAHVPVLQKPIEGNELQLLLTKIASAAPSERPAPPPASRDGVEASI
jgi:hypothetical protein